MKCILLNQSRIVALLFFYFRFISSLYTDYCSSTTETPVTWDETTEAETSGAAAIHLNLSDTDEINGMINDIKMYNNQQSSYEYSVAFLIEYTHQYIFNTITYISQAYWWHYE